MSEQFWGVNFRMNTLSHNTEIVTLEADDNLILTVGQRELRCDLILQGIL